MEVIIHNSPRGKIRYCSPRGKRLTVVLLLASNSGGVEEYICTSMCTSISMYSQMYIHQQGESFAICIATNQPVYTVVIPLMFACIRRLEIFLLALILNYACCTCRLTFGTLMARACNLYQTLSSHANCAR